MYKWDTRGTLLNKLLIVNHQSQTVGGIPKELIRSYFAGEQVIENFDNFLVPFGVLSDLGSYLAIQLYKNNGNSIIVEKEGHKSVIISKNNFTDSDLLFPHLVLYSFHIDNDKNLFTFLEPNSKFIEDAKQYISNKDDHIATALSTLLDKVENVESYQNPIIIKYQLNEAVIEKWFDEAYQ